MKTLKSCTIFLLLVSLCNVQYIFANQKNFKLSNKKKNPITAELIKLNANQEGLTHELLHKRFPKENINQCAIPSGKTAIRNIQGNACYLIRITHPEGNQLATENYKLCLSPKKTAHLSYEKRRGQPHFRLKQKGLTFRRNSKNSFLFLGATYSSSLPKPKVK